MIEKGAEGDMGLRLRYRHEFSILGPVGNNVMFELDFFKAFCFHNLT